MMDITPTSKNKHLMVGDFNEIDLNWYLIVI
jgi:hypothetical protein